MSEFNQRLRRSPGSSVRTFVVLSLLLCCFCLFAGFFFYYVETLETFYEFKYFKKSEFVYSCEKWTLVV